MMYYGIIQYNNEHTRRIYDTFGRGVYVCVRVCTHGNLKTIADICFLLSNYVSWRKHLRRVRM